MTQCIKCGSNTDLYSCGTAVCIDCDSNEGIVVEPSGDQDQHLNQKACDLQSTAVDQHFRGWQLVMVASNSPTLR